MALCLLIDDELDELTDDDVLRLAELAALDELDELDELDVVPAASTCWGRTKDKTIIIANTNVAIRDQI